MCEMAVFVTENRTEGSGPKAVEEADAQHENAQRPIAAAVTAAFALVDRDLGTWRHANLVDRPRTDRVGDIARQPPEPRRLAVVEQPAGFFGLDTDEERLDRRVPGHDRANRESNRQADRYAA